MKIFLTPGQIKALELVLGESARLSDCVRVRPDEAVVTDGHIMLRLRLRDVEDPHNNSCLLPREFVSSVRMLARGSAPLAVEMVEKTVSTTVGKTVIQGEMGSLKEFPPVDSVVLSKGDVQVGANPVLLGRLCKAFEAMGLMMRIYLDPKALKGGIVIEGVMVDGNRHENNATAVLMPLDIGRPRELS